MLVNGLTLELGTIVKFKTKNPQDPQLWQGTIIAFGNYAIARAYTDVAAYHQQVLVAEPALDPIEELDFIVIECSDADQTVRAFAVDWITVVTLAIVDTSNDATIKVYNVTTEQALVLKQLIQDQGFACKIL